MLRLSFIHMALPDPAVAFESESPFDLNLLRNRIYFGLKPPLKQNLLWIRVSLETEYTLDHNPL